MSAGRVSDPLAAVPHVAPGVVAKRDRTGGLQIRRELPDRPGWRDWLARRAGLRRAARVDLDERGSRFWNLIDGRRSLAEIAARIEQDLAIGRRESRDSAVAFTKALMLRHLIALELPQGAEKQPKNRQHEG